jgi:hypothetical protein
MAILKDSEGNQIVLSRLTDHHAVDHAAVAFAAGAPPVKTKENKRDASNYL